MSITLCMVLRNEAAILPACLGSIVQHVDEILIADTGSTDSTKELVHSICHATIFDFELDPKICFSVAPARNFLYEKVSTDWIFYLDADEILEMTNGALIRDVVRSANGNTGGFFGRWITMFPDRPTINDYKLFLFRKDLRTRADTVAGRVGDWPRCRSRK
jgi:glycosyltransferase involved in cell wall biosynthesis